MMCKAGHYSNVRIRRDRKDSQDTTIDEASHSFAKNTYFFGRLSIRDEQKALMMKELSSETEMDRFRR
jgi:hypothetical protein